MNGNQKPLQLPCSKEEFVKATGGQVVALQNGQLNIIIGVEGGRWHLSLSCRSRLPKYAEMKYMRYKLLPDDCYMAQIFPPKKEFVNLQENTLHLWEVEHE
jgi:hypothetical protein